MTAAEEVEARRRRLRDESDRDRCVTRNVNNTQNECRTFSLGWVRILYAAPNWYLLSTVYLLAILDRTATSTVSLIDRPGPR